MAAPTLTREQFFALRPCKDDRDRIIDALGGKDGWVAPITAEQAREAGATLNDLIWVASAVSRTDTDVDRRMRLWLADCAAHVLHIYERTGMSHAPRNAILAARQFARGEIGADDLVAASDAAWDAARDAAWDAARDAARDAAWAAAWDAAWDAARDAAWAAEEAWQFDRLVLWLSDDEPEDWPLPSLNEGDA